MAKQTTHSNFLSLRSNELAELLRRYLKGEVDHSRAQELAWSVIDTWREFGIGDKTADTPEEEVFWATVCALQHLADSEHWAEGVTQRELKALHDSLVTGAPLPSGHNALRP